MEIQIHAKTNTDLELAEQLAEHLFARGVFAQVSKVFSEEAKLVYSDAAPQTTGLHLSYENGVLSLCDEKLSMCGNFEEQLPRIEKEKWRHEMLVKAVKMKQKSGPLRIVDATAGMGEDSILLAAAGHEVTLCEYDPIISALLANALTRAKTSSKLAPFIKRMHFVEGDSIAYLSGQMQGQSPDVVFLDPMFPERQKSGLIKKKFQLLQQLESPCTNEEELFAAALLSKTAKIVVKRPAKGPFLAGKKPDYSVEGKAIRYDCYINLNR